jgi:hypothetical protein
MSFENLCLREYFLRICAHLDAPCVENQLIARTDVHMAERLRGYLH